MGPFPARIRDVGVVIDLATHDIDISRYLLRSEPRRILAETAQHIHTEHEDMLAHSCASKTVRLCSWMSTG